MSRLEKLPSELLLAIAGEETLRLKDVGALSRCTKSFHAAFNRLLYRRDAQSPTRWALLWSCMSGNANTTRMSVAAGSNVNEPYDYRLVEWHTGEEREPKVGRRLSLTESPLNVAVMREREEVIGVLLEHNAKLTSIYGFETAIIKGFDGVLKLYLPLLLEKTNALDMTEAFELAAKHEKEQILLDLVAATRNDDRRVDHDFFALLRAAEFGSFAWFKKVYDMDLLASQDRRAIAELWTEFGRTDNDTGDQAFTFMLSELPWLVTYFHDTAPSVWGENLDRGNAKAVKKLWPYIDAEMFLHEPEELVESAITSGNYELVEFILEKCSKYNECIDEQLPLFLVGCACQHGTPEIIKLLEARGGNLKALHDGKDAMHYAIKGANRDVVTYLLDNGFALPTDASDSLWARGSFDPFPEAEKGPSVEFVKLLLENGAKANAVNAHGTRPLLRLFNYYAFGDGDASQGFDIFFEMMKLLVSHGADINYAMQHSDMTRYFCEAGTRFVQYLLDQSAFDNVSNTELYNWFRAAYDWKDPDVIKLLLPRVLASIKTGQFPEFRQFDQSSAEINGTSFKVRTGRYEVLKLLLAHDEFRGHRAHFFIINLCTARCPDPKSLRLLLENGVDVQSRNYENARETLLHIACYHNHPSLIQVLLEAGADVNALDDNERVPFDCITENMLSDWPLDPTAMTQLLLMYGADTGIRELTGSMAEKVDKIRESWKKRSVGGEEDDGFAQFDELHGLGALGNALVAMGAFADFEGLEGSDEDEDEDDEDDEDDEFDEDSEDYEDYYDEE